MKDLIQNLAVLPIQTLHELHQGVSDELQVQEQHELLVINEVKTNNQHMFKENVEALKEWEEVFVCSQQLEAAIGQSCREVLEL